MCLSIKLPLFHTKPNFLNIKTPFYNLDNLGINDSSNRWRRAHKLANFLKGDHFNFIGTLLLVFSLLVFRGSSGEGQPTLFSYFIHKYVEETSASISSYTQSPLQLAEISTLAASNTVLGQGGPEDQTDPATPSSINDSSLLAHNPSEEDYIEAYGVKRSQIAEYIVQPGDLLSFIASDYGVSINSIIWANGLKDADSISPGQTLKIPPITGVIHRVKKGDTLASIAKKYGADETRILEFNTLPQSGEIIEGDDLIIPDGQIKTTYIATSGTTSTTSKTQRFSYLPNLGDYFMLPTNGYNWGYIHGRNGVDMANSCGTPIYAAADGTVTVSDATGYNGGFGKYIKLSHANGTETLYAHATKLLVSIGDYITRGQMIALMGSTGRSTGCHLHFEVHGAKNPMAK